MSKIRPQKTKLSTYILIAGYLGIVGIFVASVISLPKWINRFEKQYIEKTEYIIYEAICTTPMPELSTKLHELYTEHSFELALQDDTGIIFRTLPGSDYQGLRGTINSRAIVAEVQGIIERDDDKKLDAWYVIYRPTLQEYMSNMTIYQIVFLFISFLIILIILFILQNITIKPLNNLRKSIEKLNSYEFDQIHVETDDLLNIGVQKFAHDLKKNIQVVSQNHSELEQALQLERERLTNLMMISRGLVHDLKTPVHQTLIENDLLYAHSKEMSSETSFVVEYNIKRMESILSQINEILSLMESDVKSMMEVKNEFNIAKMFKEIRGIFETELLRKQQFIEAELPDSLVVKINKVAIYLIIHNLLSNAVHYAKNDSDITFIIDENDSGLVIVCSNNTALQNIKRIQRSEDLFYEIKMQNEETADYTYSSGNGLYLIKELSRMLGGTYELMIVEDLVTITTQIPY